MHRKPFSACALFLAAVIAIAGLTSCGSTRTDSSSGGATPPAPAPSESSTAHLYVAAYGRTTTSNPSPSDSTYGFSVADDGQFTQLSGFPLSYGLNGVISGSYLFALNPDGVHIDSYLINSDGSLAKTQSFDDTQASAAACSECAPGAPMLADRTGSKLYLTAGWLDGGDSDSYLQTFAVNQSTGAITYVSSDFRFSGRDWGQQWGWFSANDAFLYGTNETIFSTSVTLAVQGVDGSLSAPSGNGPVVSGLASNLLNSAVVGTDAANHVAAAFQYGDANGNPVGPIQLASFTIDSNGNLTTTNSAAQIPVAASWIGSVSPDGTLIAMAGTNNYGIQIYNFNGADPITPAGGPIATDPIAQLTWDKHHHLYALTGSQKVYVFNVNSAGASQAPDSPHSIPNAAALLVQP